ncbi:hypothetical protein [Frateuria defendens]|uniref:hypothetical protein n=1 Tax=Frateuria defendens TaxID=2219559 RepID=UPI001292EE26|nr:hypothetical protein [Frateuria defendens]
MKCNDLDFLRAYLLKKHATVEKGPVDNKQTFYNMGRASSAASRGRARRAMRSGTCTCSTGASRI